VPKRPQAHLDARRAQILAGARTVFASEGYEGATVTKLERQIGLSRGAIFNYFPSKWEIFFALAQEDMLRIGALWVEEGYDEALRTLAGSNPDWLGVYFEVARKFRHDPDLRRQWSQRAPDIEVQVVEQIRRLQADGTYRADATVDEIGRFLGVVIDGVVSQASFGERFDVEGVLKLVRTAVGSGKPPK
jgi:AcrR family transcriptional regulator